MDEQRLAAANVGLQQPPVTKSRRRLWLIIAIVISIFIVALVMIAWLVRSSTSSSTYPYIPAPTNTIRSTSLHDLFLNMMADSGEPAIKYSVIARLGIDLKR